MKYEIQNTKRFDKDLKRCYKRGLPMAKIAEAIRLLQEHGSLPKEYNPHILHGNYEGLWECHINDRNSDWLMVWSQNDTELTLLMLRTGSHADIF
ncbi:type II toxin-antitoxin system YafQ family toxin [Prevotella sp. PINT]|jgi:addiction module toxin, RelE/StbE family|uniref:type II toxin-antitoxin system YafQ family toxin n=1 Tax=Palleniella intestinalis TaxID=2736291 RepID=UPI0015551534|nr:type II toxin-antitoxin system YafQ family toxin [Palleniella intestinalis]NPD81748.1 type II toxin-antitoxin system YafQ family toxin [Palleniella intestinalis]